MRVWASRTGDGFVAAESGMRWIGAVSGPHRGRFAIFGLGYLRNRSSLCDLGGQAQFFPGSRKVITSAAGKEEESGYSLAWMMTRPPSSTSMFRL